MMATHKCVMTIKVFMNERNLDDVYRIGIYSQLPETRKKVEALPKGGGSCL